MEPLGASVLFSPVQIVALASGLKDPLIFTPKPHCSLQNAPHQNVRLMIVNARYNLDFAVNARTHTHI